MRSRWLVSERWSLSPSRGWLGVVVGLCSTAGIWRWMLGAAAPPLTPATTTPIPALAARLIGVATTPLDAAREEPLRVAAAYQLGELAGAGEGAAEAALLATLAEAATPGEFEEGGWGAARSAAYALSGCAFLPPWTHTVC